MNIEVKHLSNYFNIHELKILNVLMMRKIQRAIHHKHANICCSSVKTTRKHVGHCHTLTSSAIIATSDELLVGI